MDNHAFFRLPAELRLTIYENVFASTKIRPLYIDRHIWSWTETCLKQAKSRNCHALLLVCRRMHDDVQTFLYSKHELQFYTTSPSIAQENVRKQVCRIEDYKNVFLHVQRLRLKIFAECKSDEDTLLALMAYLKAIFAERQVPLKALHIEMCATEPKYPRQTLIVPKFRGHTAILYAAQGLRSFGLTTFHFHGGFSGVGSEDAIEALMAHASKEEQSSPSDDTQEKALKRLKGAWAAAQPAWYDPRFVSNRRLQIWSD